VANKGGGATDLAPLHGAGAGQRRAEGDSGTWSAAAALGRLGCGRKMGRTGRLGLVGK
jgi:hypothetical protein